MNPPSVDDPRAVEALRAALDRGPYTGNAIRAALGSEGEILSRPREMPVQIRRLRGRGPYGALVQCFVLSEPADASLMREALAPASLETCAAMGLLRVEGDRVIPQVKLVPHDDLIIVSDLRFAPGEPAPPDHVPGVHRPSVTLSHLTVRTPVERGLDLGCGNGVEAILMRRHVTHVVGSDVNARSIAFARFNGMLNGAPDIDWRVGSWFEPMRGETFDVITCNPPYVISPASQYIYRDSGMRGDSVSEQVVREVGAHLAEGGYGMLAFDPKTNTFDITESSDGVLTVGTQGGVSRRGVQEFDASSVLPLLNAGAGTLTLTVNEVRGTPPSPITPPDPNLHVDVILYGPADLALSEEDLTRDGKRLGSLHVQPERDPASLELNFTNEVREAALGTFGIRIQLRGTPIAGDQSGPGDEGPEELVGRDASASFTLDVRFDSN